MKKFLLTAALVLALVTSLTAGTMAYYTTTVSTTSDVHTQKFEYTVLDASSSTTEDVDIIPGDTATYEFTVANNSEIDITSTLTYSLQVKDASGKWVDAAGNNGEIEGLSFTVKRSEAGKPAKDYTSGTDVNMVQNQTDKYTVTIAWNYSAGRNDDSGKDLKLSLSANGQQASKGDDSLTVASGFKKPSVEE